MSNPSLNSSDLEVVFLVSSIRSGSTVLNLMLGHHPEIFWMGECDFLHVPLTNGLDSLTVDTFLNRLKLNRIFEDRKFSIDSSLTKIKDLTDSFFYQKNTQNKKVMGGTLHHDFSKILSLYPKARFISLLRDPRDVAYSVCQMGLTGTAYFAVDHWLKADKALNELKTKVEKNRICEVYFEKLIENPVSELTRICKFIGVEFNTQQFEYASKSTYSLPDKSRNYAWKQKKDYKELAWIEWKLDHKHTKYGYESIASVCPTKNEMFKLQLQEYSNRKLVNLKKFGTLKYAAFLFCKALSFIPWFEKQGTILLNEVTRKQLK